MHASAGMNRSGELISSQFYIRSTLAPRLHVRVWSARREFFMTYKSEKIHKAKADC